MAFFRDFLNRRINEAELSPEALVLAESLAVRQAALYIASSYIIDTLSKCEVRTYEKGKPVKGELYWALNVSPNPNQTGSELMEEYLRNLVYQGEALLVQPKRGAAQFHVADSFTVDENVMRGNTYRDVVLCGRMGSIQLNRRFAASDVMYVTYGNRKVRQLVDGICADMGRVLAASQDAFIADRSQRFTLSMQGASQGTRTDEKDAQSELRDRFLPLLKSGSVIIPLHRGQDLARIQGTGNSSAADVVALRKDVFDTVASMFKIPNSMLYGNMTNIADIMQQFMTFAIDPIAEKLNDAFTRSIYGFDAWAAGSRVKVDTTQVTHLDVFNVADKAEKLLGSGIYSIDAILERMGDDALGTEYSTSHWMTKNFASIEDVLDQLDG